MTRFLQLHIYVLFAQVTVAAGMMTEVEVDMGEEEVVMAAVDMVVVSNFVLEIDCINVIGG